MTSAVEWPEGWRVIALTEIDSTNSEAFRRAAAGDQGPVWITAREQTRGRGRSGRSWATTDGNLAATLLVEPGCEMPALPQLAIVAGLAAYDAIACALPVDRRGSLRLKWPNDALIDGAKASGILVESTVSGRSVAAAIGIGINLSVVPEITGRAVTSLASHGGDASFDAMSLRLARALAAWLAAWDRGRRFDLIRQAFLERSIPNGQRMTVNTGTGTATGAFAGLDEEGALLIRSDDGSVLRYTFGDVALAGQSV